MIMDHLNNASLYEPLHPGIATALAYLRSRPIAGLAPGRYDIEGDDLFLLIQTYDTRPMEQGFWEAHRRYLDIQYMIAGAERMGCAHADALRVTEDHLEEKDYRVLEGEGNFLTVKEGEFVIFYPHDAHMPCMAVDAPEPVKKAVFKVRLS